MSALPAGALPATGALPADLGWLEEHLLALWDLGPAGPMALAAAVAAALLVGAAHAAGPGHGKTVVAAYLAGGNGRTRDALALGAVVAALHTASVVSVALVLVAAARTAEVALVDAAGGWLRLAAGLLVAAVGVGMLARAVRARRTRRARTHHGAAADSTDPAHTHGHAHALGPLPAGVHPLSRQGVVLLGAAGGLLPSPSALLVLAGGLLTGRLGVAVALVAAFGVGLGATIAGVGVAVLRGRDALADRVEGSLRLRRLQEAVPLGAALLLVGAGAVMTLLGAARLLG